MIKSIEFISIKLFYKKVVLWKKKINYILMSIMVDLENGLILV